MLRIAVAVPHDPLFECVPQLSDHCVAGHNCISQLLLLAPYLYFELRLFGLQLPQTPYVRPIGSANEVRQQVDFGKDFALQKLVRRRVRQRRPAGAGNFTTLHCLLPKSAHLLCGFCLCELVDRDSVPAIECLMEQLRPPLTLAGKQYPAGV
jgi:hypothetical protein